MYITQTRRLRPTFAGDISALCTRGYLFVSLAQISLAILVLWALVCILSIQVKARFVAFQFAFEHELSTLTDLGLLTGLHSSAF